MRNCFIEEKIAVCSEINAKHIKHCWQNTEFLNVKDDGTYINMSEALKG